jgi:hypothetical protein
MPIVLGQKVISSVEEPGENVTRLSKQDSDVLQTVSDDFQLECQLLGGVLRTIRIIKITLFERLESA